MGLIIVCVGVVVHQGKVLIIKRSNPEGRLVYQFPAGKKETWENEKQGTVREVKEETGCDVKATVFLGERLHPYTKVHMTYWGCKLIHGCEDTYRTKDAIDEILWVEKDALDKYFTTDVYEPVQEWIDGCEW